MEVLGMPLGGGDEKPLICVWGQEIRLVGGVQVFG
jgi:hypothetical protein